MARKFNINDLKILLDRLSMKTGEGQEFYGLGRISDLMNNEVSQKYLYYSLVKPIDEAKTNGITELNLAPNKIEAIAKFLGFETFGDFIKSVDEPINPILIALLGNYNSYVRKNASQMTLLQSPVEIVMEKGDVIFRLSGPVWTYTGKMCYENGCVFCLMRSESGKYIHHVYKIGSSIAPSILMGVFSGISSANEPIAGRCVLIRNGLNEGRGIVMKISYQEALNSQNPRLHKLANYFKDYENNNLKIDISKGFDIDDL